MAVRIRLSRTGAKKQPAYRLIVANSSSPRDGAFIETIGHYNPTQEPEILKVDEERALHWLRKGAQPSDTAKMLLTRAGVMEKFSVKPTA